MVEWIPLFAEIGEREVCAGKGRKGTERKGFMIRHISSYIIPHTPSIMIPDITTPLAFYMISIRLSDLYIYLRSIHTLLFVLPDS